jgi:hypothetical protein
MFNVPEQHRVVVGPLASNQSYGNNGCFLIPTSEKSYAVIASDGMGWEHVSVHVQVVRGNKIKHCTPTWEDMCFVKGQFWSDEDVVLQFHPKKSEYVNNHPNVLHLWRPTGDQIPTPPPILVGIKEIGVIEP